MDVFAGICRIKRAFVKDRRFENLYLMSASPRKDDRDITPLHMEVLCNKIKDSFDYILIDCPAGIGNGLEVAMAGADRALIVTEADMAALRDADIVHRHIKKAGITNTCYVVNKVRADLMERKLIPDLNEISETMGSKMIGIIQFDDNIYVSTNRGIPIVFKKGTYIEENFQNIKRRFIACGKK
jgi:septum site-determining protein MinD